MERPEHERSWSGRLEERDPPAGPATRKALGYALVTRDRELAVYSASMDSILAPLVGSEVSGRGKLVDLSPEGQGLELWLASVDRVDPQLSQARPSAGALRPTQRWEVRGQVGRLDLEHLDRLGQAAEAPGAERLGGRVVADGRLDGG